MNPVKEVLLLTRANERLNALRYDPPASWTNEAKLRFLELPADLQIYLVAREKQRDGAVKKSQREAAECRKTLADTQQQLEAAQHELAELKSKEQEDGTAQDA